MESPEYRRMYEAEGSYWWFVSRRRLARRLLDAHAPPPGTWLDLGCGTGAATLAFSESAPTVGLDVSAEALRFARGRGLRRLVQGDAQRLPFRDASFAAVVTLDTLEHLDRDDLALAEIARVLVPGGALMVNVPAFRFLWGPHDRALMHRRRYTKRELVARIEAAGLVVERASYSLFLVFPGVLLQRLAAKAFGRGVKMPRLSPRANSALVRLLDLEAGWMLKAPLPWGSSVAAVARKPVSARHDPA